VRLRIVQHRGSHDSEVVRAMVFARHGARLRYFYLTVEDYYYGGLSHTMS
jgi:hypothetical protein